MVLGSGAGSASFSFFFAVAAVVFFFAAVLVFVGFSWAFSVTVSSSPLSMTSRKMKRSQETRKDSGVFFSPMPMTTLPASRSRVASLLKSPSLETMQKPCTSPP